jgi:hypothetical protein
MHSLKSSDMSRQSSGIRERVGWGRGQGGGISLGWEPQPTERASGGHTWGE